VVTIVLDSKAESAVEKIALPPDIRRGQPIEARVVIENYTKPDPKTNPTGEVKGRLRVTRRYSNQDEPLAASPDSPSGDMAVTLKPRHNDCTLQPTLDLPAAYTYP